MKIIDKIPTGFLRNRWIIHTEEQGSNLILHEGTSILKSFFVLSGYLIFLNPHLTNLIK